MDPAPFSSNESEYGISNISLFDISDVNGLSPSFEQLTIKNTKNNIMRYKISLFISTFAMNSILVRMTFYCPPNGSAPDVSGCGTDNFQIVLIETSSC